MNRRNFIKVAAAIAVTPVGTAHSVLLQGERRMKTEPVTFPEALVLWNPVADYYYKMNLAQPVSVQAVKESKKHDPCALRIYEWTQFCGIKLAVLLRGISIKAKGSEAAMNSALVTVSLDGERVVNRLPLRKAERIRGQDLSFEEKRTSLFRAVTMERQIVGMFMPNGTHVTVDLFRPENPKDSGLVVEMRLDMAEYVCIKVPDGVRERHQYRWGWWDAADAAPKG